MNRAINVFMTAFFVCPLLFLIYTLNFFGAGTYYLFISSALFLISWSTILIEKTMRDKFIAPDNIKFTTKMVISMSVFWPAWLIWTTIIRKQEE